ncbi:fumarylacetoacetate hydrolase family protein [Pseudonocardia broussonetiae]|uniref:Fumarylacetoacetate hydrolase family protein n=1 Tax=Pseudonocardia broussonetiae TaxID=2736640 RepID=A0A6M6JKI0_9PSEU|nr:fumarylacetoacetate hydrolase family protein [Pseudonocardia broussonetiae]QJY47735.1 fumarylacetoacetate hydrolase family protein [Pseudonocardia broussonetiae]
MHAPPWSLVQYTRAGHTGVSVGALVDDKIVRTPPGLGDGDLMAVLRRWAEVAPLLRTWTPDSDDVVPDAVLAAPLTYPAKILCAGANYYAHLAEMGIAAPATPPEPFFFFKPPTTTVIGPGAAIPLPVGDTRIDWEAELGVVIADRCRDLSPEDVAGHIAGYLPANDISARSRLTRSDAVAAPFGFDWVGSKAQDGFCPLGPGLVPAWLVGDTADLAVRLLVNGVVKQDSSTADMISPVADLVAAVSRMVTLEPGDLVLTGTPAGVGLPREEFLAPGDEVVVEIDRVGRLVNPVVAS